MPVHLTWEQHGLYRLFTDSVTSDLLVRIKEANIGDERFDTVHYTICDFSGVSDFSSRSEDLAYLCALDRATALYRPGICIASVAPDERNRVGDAVAAGLGRFSVPSRGLRERPAGARLDRRATARAGLRLQSAEL